MQAWDCILKNTVCIYAVVEHRPVCFNSWILRSPWEKSFYSQILGNTRWEIDIQMVLLRVKFPSNDPFITRSQFYPSDMLPDKLKLTICRHCYRCLCFPRFPPWPKTAAGMGTLRAQPSMAGPTTTARQSSPMGPQWCQLTAIQLLLKPRLRASSSRGSRLVSPFLFWQAQLSHGKPANVKEASENKYTDFIRGLGEMCVFLAL